METLRPNSETFAVIAQEKRRIPPLFLVYARYGWFVSECRLQSFNARLRQRACSERANKLKRWAAVRQGKRAHDAKTRKQLRGSLFRVTAKGTFGIASNGAGGLFGKPASTLCGLSWPCIQKLEETAIVIFDSLQIQAFPKFTGAGMLAECLSMRCSLNAQITIRLQSAADLLTCAC